MASLASDRFGHWLSLYATAQHEWHSIMQNGRLSFYRRQGIVENLFDADGIDFEGRADLSIGLHVTVACALDQEQLKERVLLCWAVLRQSHVLLSSSSVYGEEIAPDAIGRRWVDKCFLYQVPHDVSEAMQAANESMSYMNGETSGVDYDEFYKHAMNTARVVDARQRLSRLFVFPDHDMSARPSSLRLLIIAGHQVADGLSVFRWANHFIDLLNTSPHILSQMLESAISDPRAVLSRLPPCQESLYPPRGRTIAAQRWNWLITRLLRHVRRPAPRAFPNPLARRIPLSAAEDLPPTYATALDYSKKPPLNCFVATMDLSQRATHNLIRLCRQAGISVGSGAFVLVGMVMMRFEEIRNPYIHFTDRPPFIGSFPLNPRPFLSGKPTTGKEDSLMLAFSDGVILPFIPSHLDLQKSFRVLGRLAHRQLRRYQKRKRTLQEELSLGSHSPSQLLPSLYLETFDRLNNKVKPEQRLDFNPQGAYPVQPGYPGTCGISSIGDRTALIDSRGYDLDQIHGQDLVADFIGLKSSVRARYGEFLVGAAGTKDMLGFLVSYDGSLIDPDKVQQWQQMIKDTLDYDMEEQKLATMHVRSRL